MNEDPEYFCAPEERPTQAAIAHYMALLMRAFEEDSATPKPPTHIETQALHCALVGLLFNVAMDGTGKSLEEIKPLLCAQIMGTRLMQ